MTMLEFMESSNELCLEFKTCSIVSAELFSQPPASLDSEEQNVRFRLFDFHWKHSLYVAFSGSVMSVVRWGFRTCPDSSNADCWCRRCSTWYRWTWTFTSISLISTSSSYDCQGTLTWVLLPGTTPNWRHHGAPHGSNQTIGVPVNLNAQQGRTIGGKPKTGWCQKETDEGMMTRCWICDSTPVSATPNARASFVLPNLWRTSFLALQQRHETGVCPFLTLMLLAMILEMGPWVLKDAMIANERTLPAYRLPRGGSPQSI